jgi:predicted HicB family RNase H-like nuclease
MSSLSLRLPDSLHAKIRELAARDDVSINQRNLSTILRHSDHEITVRPRPAPTCA